MVELSIALGVIISLFFVEAFGMAAGGIVVPGYIALQLSHLDKMLGTLLISFLTFLIIKFLSKYTFLYGRRQMVLALLVGSLLSIFSHEFLDFNITYTTIQFSAVGWVVPGLIGHWAVKQGLLKTIFMLSITSILIRLIVILIYNGNIIQ
ncbi:MAG: poly-gamma-glutamate biosynthesis protein PgsC [Bacteroidota bacterium]